MLFLLFLFFLLSQPNTCFGALSVIDRSKKLTEELQTINQHFEQSIQDALSQLQTTYRNHETFKTKYINEHGVLTIESTEKYEHLNKSHIIFTLDDAFAKYFQEQKSIYNECISRLDFSVYNLLKIIKSSPPINGLMNTVTNNFQQLIDEIKNFSPQKTSAEKLLFLKNKMAIIAFVQIYKDRVMHDILTTMLTNSKVGKICNIAANLFDINQNTIPLLIQTNTELTAIFTNTNLKAPSFIATVHSWGKKASDLCAYPEKIIPMPVFMLADYYHRKLETTLQNIEITISNLEEFDQKKTMQNINLLNKIFNITQKNPVIYNITAKLFSIIPRLIINWIKKKPISLKEKVKILEFNRAKKKLQTLVKINKGIMNIALNINPMSKLFLVAQEKLLDDAIALQVAERMHEFNQIMKNLIFQSKQHIKQTTDSLNNLKETITLEKTLEQITDDELKKSFKVITDDLNKALRKSFYNPQLPLTTLARLRSIPRLKTIFLNSPSIIQSQSKIIKTYFDNLFPLAKQSLLNYLDDVTLFLADLSPQQRSAFQSYANPTQGNAHQKLLYLSALKNISNLTDIIFNESSNQTEEEKNKIAFIKTTYPGTQDLKAQIHEVTTEIKKFTKEIEGLTKVYNHQKTYLNQYTSDKDFYKKAILTYQSTAQKICNLLLSILNKLIPLLHSECVLSFLDTFDWFRLFVTHQLYIKECIEKYNLNTSTQYSYVDDEGIVNHSKLKYSKQDTIEINIPQLIDQKTTTLNNLTNHKLHLQSHYQELKHYRTQIKEQIDTLWGIK